MVEEKMVSLEQMKFLASFNQAQLARSHKMGLEIDERNLQTIDGWSKKLDELKIVIQRYLEGMSTLGLDAPALEEAVNEIHRITGEMNNHTEFRLNLVTESLTEINQEIPELDREVKELSKVFGQPKMLKDALEEME